MAEHVVGITKKRDGDGKPLKTKSLEKTLKCTENESLNIFSVKLFQLEKALERNAPLCMLDI
jgi:hypothetical protein